MSDLDLARLLIEHYGHLMMEAMIEDGCEDPSVAGCASDHVIVASWSEAARWTYIDINRLAALEAVAEAARSHLDALSTMNWPRQGGKNHLFPSADALNRALADLGGPGNLEEAP